jgi:hypothetical protein
LQERADRIDMSQELADLIDMDPCDDGIDIDLDAGLEMNEKTLRVAASYNLLPTCSPEPAQVSRTNSSAGHSSRRVSAQSTSSTPRQQAPLLPISGNQPPARLPRRQRTSSEPQASPSVPSW